MFYKFTAIKSVDSSDEYFESALYCSFQSIQSTLIDYNLHVTIQSPSIYISLPCESVSNGFPLSLGECKGLIKSAFLDDKKMLYPEFSLIKIDAS